MRVLLDASLFSPEFETPTALIRLFDLGVEGRHALQPDPLDMPELTAWLSTHRQSLKDQCRLALDYGLEADTHGRLRHEIRVANRATSDWNTTPPTCGRSAKEAHS